MGSSMGVAVLFWRSGKEGQQWWYDGTVKCLKEVTFPNGARRTLMAIN